MNELVRRLIPSMELLSLKVKFLTVYGVCKKCEAVLYDKELEKSLYVCSNVITTRIGARKELICFGTHFHIKK